jgi:hypothetical protein
MTAEPAERQARSDLFAARSARTRTRTRIAMYVSKIRPKRVKSCCSQITFSELSMRGAQCEETREPTCLPSLADVAGSHCSRAIMARHLSTRQRRLSLESQLTVSGRIRGSAAFCHSGLCSASRVTICGHRWQAAGPSCLHQRQSGRIEQGGNSDVTSWNKVTILEASRHRPSPKCAQAPAAHGAVNRKTSVGSKGAARSSMSFVGCSACSKYATLADSGVPPTTPMIFAVAQLGCALGQRKRDVSRPILSSVADITGPSTYLLHPALLHPALLHPAAAAVGSAGPPATCRRSGRPEQQNRLRRDALPKFRGLASREGPRRRRLQTNHRYQSF